MKPNFHIPGEDLVPAIQSLETRTETPILPKSSFS